jgi:hypothetical protein
VTSVVEALVCGGPFAIPGIVLSALAVGRVRSDLHSAAVLTRRAWYCAVIAPVIFLAFWFTYGFVREAIRSAHAPPPPPVPSETPPTPEPTPPAKLEVREMAKKLQKVGLDCTILNDVGAVPEFDWRTQCHLKEGGGGVQYDLQLTVYPTPASAKSEFDKAKAYPTDPGYGRLLVIKGSRLVEVDSQVKNNVATAKKVAKALDGRMKCHETNPSLGLDWVKC